MDMIFLVAGILGIFAAIFLTLTAIGVFTNEARGVSKSLAVIQAFSAAPSEMQQELEPPFRERVLVPLTDKTLNLGKRLTPSNHGEQIRQKLEVAGNPPGWTPDRVTSLKFLGFAAMLVISLIATMLFGFGLLTTLGVVMLASRARLHGAEPLPLPARLRPHAEDAARAARTRSTCSPSRWSPASGFDAALSQVARNTDGPLAQEFARVLQEMQIGMGRSAALRALGDRTHVAEVKGFVGAMVQADALGIPIAQVLRVQSKEIRTKRRQRAEEQAQKVAVKILIPLIFCILPCLFIAVLGPAGISMFEAFSAGGCDHAEPGWPSPLARSSSRRCSGLRWSSASPRSCRARSSWRRSPRSPTSPPGGPTATTSGSSSSKECSPPS